MHLSDLIPLLEASKYFLLFAGCYLEGTGVMMTGGLLWKIGEVQFWPAYGALLAADFLSDLMWYAIGYFGGRKFFHLRIGALLGATESTMRKAEERFHHYHLRILIISKLTMGFGLATVILSTAGMLRVSLVRYITINLLCGFVWVFAMMSVGYFFGNVLDLIPTQFQVAAALGAFVLFILILRTITKRLEKIDW